MEAQPQNIALYCDDAYISLLLTDAENLENNQTLMSDENYAEKLQLQEAIMSSLIASHFPGRVFVSEENSRETGEQSKFCSMEIGESSTKVSMEIGEPSERNFMKNNGEILSQYTCEICAERKNIQDFFPIQKCTHQFCTQCISKHISIKIQKGNITNHDAYYPCPGIDCKGVLDIDTCREIVPKDVLATWDEILCESMILPRQKFYCPYKSCSGLLVNESSENEAAVIREAECPFCNRLFCAKCKVPWHSGFGCEDFSRHEKEREEDSMVHELAKKNKWQRCPSCRFFVEKKDGCLHMTCRCEFQFCYACGKAWSSNHGGCQ